MVASQALASSWGKFWGALVRAPKMMNHLTSPRRVAAWEGEKNLVLAICIFGVPLLCSEGPLVLSPGWEVKGLKIL